MIITEYGNEKYKIRLEALSTNGRGLNIFVTGGDTPHVGAVALAVAVCQCSDWGDDLRY